MRYIKLVLVFFVLVSVYCTAQESKSSLVFSGTLAHYIRSGIESGTPGIYVYPVDPGLELLYQYRLGSAFFISSGLSYQMGRISTLKGAERRFRFGEISVPIQLKSILVRSNKVNLFATGGFSYGQMAHLDWEAPTSANEWVDVRTEYEEHYSEKDSFADLLFGLGVSFPIADQNVLEISPYLIYRLKDYWMGYFRKDLYYGIKISYQLNLNRNEKK